MFEYNNKLLDLQPKVTEEDVKNMTEEQKTEMLLKLLAKKEIITDTFEVTNRDLKEDGLKQITDPHETL